MINKISISIDENGSVKKSTTILARENENLSKTLCVLLPKPIIDKWLYIEFETESNNKFTSPKLEVISGRVNYDVPQSLISEDGKLKCQIVAKNEENIVWKSNIFDFTITKSINATEQVVNSKPDVIASMQADLNQMKQNVETISDDVAAISGIDGGHLATDEDIKNLQEQINGIDIEETDPTVPSHVKNITQTDITTWDNKVSQTELNNEVKQINDSINDLENRKSDITYVDSEVYRIESIAKGANQAITYGDYATMITALNNVPKETYNVGQNIMIVTLQVPDLWIAYVEDTSAAYNYTTDENFVNELKTNGFIQIGYYKLSALETQKVDLTDCVKFTDLPTGARGGVPRVSYNYGIYATNNGTLYIDRATNTAIDEKTNNYKAIVPANLDYAIKKGLSDNKETWTDTEKTNARTLIEAVGFTDYPTANKAGVSKVEGSFGILSDSIGRLYINPATTDEIDDKTNKRKPIVPENLDYAVNSVLKERVTLTLKENGAYTLTINKE